MAEPKSKACRLSHTQMTEMVLPPDTNAHGTVFGGRVLQWIDIAGAIAAMRHAERKVVTASIDDMHFVVPIGLGDTVVLKASVNFANRTSMEVGIRVEKENHLLGSSTHAATAYVTYVALDDEGKPTLVPHVHPETEEEVRRHRNAQTRREFRLKRRDALLQKRR